MNKGVEESTSIDPVGYAIVSSFEFYQAQCLALNDIDQEIKRLNAKLDQMQEKKTTLTSNMLPEVLALYEKEAIVSKLRS